MGTVSILDQGFDKQIIVQQASDFPAPIGGEVQGEDNVCYVIDGVVTVVDTFVPGVNSCITSFGNPPNELNYTGTGSMFKGRNIGITVTNVTLRCANGTLHDWIDTSPVHDSVVEFSGVVVAECKHAGSATDVKQFRYFANVMSDIKTTGHQFFGDIEQIFSVDTDYVNNSTTPTYDLGTVTSDLIWVLDYQSEVSQAGGSWLSGLVDSGNINAGGLGQLHFGLNLGPGTDLVGITTDDTFWQFAFLNRIPDTDPHALIFLLNNATETEIETKDTPVIIAGTYAVQTESIYDGDTAGRITYNGESDVTARINTSMTAFTITGSAKDVTFYVAKNGSVIANSGISNNVRLNVKGNTTSIWQEDLVKGDFIEIFVENNDDTTNITVEDLNMSVSS